MTIKDDRIQALRSEAATAGDLRMVAICEIALGADGTDAEPGTDLAIAAVQYTTQTARAAVERACVCIDCGNQGCWPNSVNCPKREW